MEFEKYDVVVIGAGHAGAEAAAAAARLGAKTLLITHNLDSICQMSCNPAMGGVAKGQIVREIDAMGGWSGIVTDRSMIQFRMLNSSKGPAMWSPRAQCDKARFSLLWRQVLENIPRLQLWQDDVDDVIIEGGRVVGVHTHMQITIPAEIVILTGGTFLNGRIYIGETVFEGGRIGEVSSKGLAESLMNKGFQVEKLKTGTPVRIDGRTIDFDRLDLQFGDENPQKFSFSTETKPLKNQNPCYIAYTNTHTHDILKKGFDKSPMFTGRIQGRGPRYCPSIEDKINRFAGKDRHQLFVEPEGQYTNSYYLNGFSSSLPLEVQLEALHSIVGFEKARIFKPGYAIEYDYFPPTQLKFSLETKLVEGLFFAGQVNGTTGYEEAACQGLMAGINAVMKLRGKPAVVLSRSQAYIGVLIDDLVTKGVDEPYRMFTSRAEYRILLRQDNADVRLTPLSFSLGLASEERMNRVDRKMKYVDKISRSLSEISVMPDEVNGYLGSINSSLIQQRVKLINLLLRPEVVLNNLAEISESLKSVIMSVPDDLRSESCESAEVLLKYERYIEKERNVAEKILKFDTVPIRDDFDYNSLLALSYEAREKLSKMRPRTIGQASRISGVSPADVTVLLIAMGC